MCAQRLPSHRAVASLPVARRSGGPGPEVVPLCIVYCLDYGKVWAGCQGPLCGAGELITDYRQLGPSPWPTNKEIFPNHGGHGEYGDREAAGLKPLSAGASPEN